MLYKGEIEYVYKSIERVLFVTSLGVYNLFKYLHEIERLKE